MQMSRRGSRMPRAQHTATVVKSCTASAHVYFFHFFFFPPRIFRLLLSSFRGWCGAPIAGDSVPGSREPTGSLPVMLRGNLKCNYISL